MKNKKSIREEMFENIQAMYNEDVKQGEIMKKFQESQNRKSEFLKEAFIYGANYYTEEKLKEIRGALQEYLYEDIDIEDIKGKITNSTEPDIGTLEYLYKLEDKILEVKERLDNNCEPFPEKDGFLKSSIVGMIDWLNGGGSDED